MIRLVFVVLALVQPNPVSAECDLGGLPPGTEVADVRTPLGSLCIELLRDAAPLHVDNFLHYLENGSLVDTFFHRSVPGFIVQGGGFKVGAGDYEAVPVTNGLVPNEPCTRDIPDAEVPGQKICSERGNERGTVALAKLGGDPNSGSTNWFVNVVDNRSNLDNQNGGFTVFGRLIDGSIAVADAIATLTIANEDDLAWMESAFHEPPSVPVPLLEPPLSSAVGCWDPTNQATAVSAADLPDLVPFLDPVLTGRPVSFPFLFQQSTACGTPIAPPTSPTDLPVDSCASPGGIAVRVTGPSTLLFPGGSPSFVSFTCAQVLESLNQRALWLTAYRAHFNEQLVVIEAASVAASPATEATEVPAISTFGMVLLGGVLLGVAIRVGRAGVAVKI